MLRLRAMASRRFRGFSGSGFSFENAKTWGGALGKNLQTGAQVASGGGGGIAVVGLAWQMWKEKEEKEQNKIVSGSFNDARAPAVKIERKEVKARLERRQLLELRNILRKVCSELFLCFTEF